LCVARGCTPPWRGPCALGSRLHRCGNATGRPPLAPRRRGRRCQLVGCPPPSGAPRARPRHPHQVGLAAAALAAPASGLVSPACAARRCQCLLRSAQLSSAYGGVSVDIICTSCYQCRQRLRPPQHQCLPGPIAFSRRHGSGGAWCSPGCAIHVRASGMFQIRESCIMTGRVGL
jgi:hypothetical protein